MACEAEDKLHRIRMEAEKHIAKEDVDSSFSYGNYDDVFYDGVNMGYKYLSKTILEILNEHN